jgi:YgiT-type zinc finger domain-containing protein
MRCAICKDGKTKPGQSVITLTRGVFAVVFKNVPAEICYDCSEEYISEDATELLLKAAEESFIKEAAISVKDWNNLI